MTDTSVLLCETGIVLSHGNNGRCRNWTDIHNSWMCWRCGIAHLTSIYLNQIITLGCCKRFRATTDIKTPNNWSFDVLFCWHFWNQNCQESRLPGGRSWFLAQREEIEFLFRRMLPEKERNNFQHSTGFFSGFLLFVRYYHFSGRKWSQFCRVHWFQNRSQP